MKVGYLPKDSDFLRVVEATDVMISHNKDTWETRIWVTLLDGRALEFRGIGDVDKWDRCIYDGKDITLPEQMELYKITSPNDKGLTNDISEFEHQNERVERNDR